VATTPSKSVAIDPLRIAVEGVIGVGKTTLVKAMAERLGAVRLSEDDLANPFLARFYKQPARWAFACQTCFLEARLRQFATGTPVGVPVVADHSLQKEPIFAAVNLADDEPLQQAMVDAGFDTIFVGIETPDEGTLRQYKRAPINDDKQREFVARCREMDIRTVAGFMIGFPDDTTADIRGVLKYAKVVNPTYANFNIVTPYPGTEFFAEVKNEIADFDFSKYTVYTPVMKYKNLTREEVLQLHAKCFTSYYFRWPYLKDNAKLLWPALRKFSRKSEAAVPPSSDKSHATPKRPHGLTILQDRPELRKDGPHNRTQAVKNNDPKSSA